MCYVTTFISQSRPSIRFVIIIFSNVDLRLTRLATRASRNCCREFITRFTILKITAQRRADMCPSLYTSIYLDPSLALQLSLKPSCQSASASASASRLTAQRKKDREGGEGGEGEGEGKKETRTVQLARAAIFPHAWKRRTTDSPDGVTSSVEFTHTNANTQRVTQRSTHTGRLTSRYTLYLERIKHQTYVRIKRARGQNLKITGPYARKKFNPREK